MVPKALFYDMANPTSDGNYFLRPDRIKVPPPCANFLRAGSCCAPFQPPHALFSQNENKNYVGHQLVPTLSRFTTRPCFPPESLGSVIVAAVPLWQAAFLLDGTSELPGNREAALEGLARERAADRAVQLDLKATERRMAANAKVALPPLAHARTQHTRSTHRE